MLSKNKIKYIQSLGQKKHREEEGLFIAEGPKILEELLIPGFLQIREVLALPSWASTHQKQLGHIPCTILEDFELEKISQLATPNQVLALVEIPVADTIPAISDQVILALDDIRDPGNLGTIVRIADWFGINAVVCSRDTTDIYNPKTVQSAMGSIGRVRLFYTTLADWLFSQTDTPVYAAVLEGEDVTTMKKVSRGIILIGNESKGISPEILEMVTDKITIPARGKAESLNAAVATGIILSHLV